ncbi:hypothetical protein [Rhodovulum sulfidophilum]|nr:hypothetical protein [Rhodovulum sulfidophilum]
MDRLSDLVETLHLVLDGVSEDEQGPELRALRALSTSVLQP